MALVGDLKELTLADIVQINCIGRNTARLMVNYPVGEGIFYFQDGEVFHATLAGLSGIDAFQSALKYTEGAFRIDAAVSSPTRTINKPWQQLLMDGMRLLDEDNQSDSKEFNPDQSIPGFDPQEFLRRTTQNIPILANEEAEHIGAIINEKYRIDAKIKSGELGTMYRATHMQMEVPVAIKVMHPFLVDDEAAMERFRRGAHAAARIHHPNAINVIDFGVANEIVYMVMEFLNGKTMRDRITKQRRLAAKEASKILKQVCAALEAAHRQDIIHRDLKPENIMFDDSSGEEIVKVLDFGLAKLKAIGGGEGVLTAHGLVMGTHDYMSPELCEGYEIDRRSDVYSLGIVLYEALTGQRPFIDPTPVGVALKHIGATPEPMRKHYPDISESIDNVVLKALAKSPADRQQTAAALAQEFEAAVNAKSSAIELPRPKSARNADDKRFSTDGIPELSGGELGESRARVAFDKFINPSNQPVNQPGNVGSPYVHSGGPLSTTNPTTPIGRREKASYQQSVMAGYDGKTGLDDAERTPTGSLISRKRKGSILNSNWVLFLLSAGVVGALFFVGLMGWQYYQSFNRPVETKTVLVNPQLQMVPPGEFQMGRDGKDVPANESPAHNVKLRTFYIGRFEVTNREYQLFVRDAKYRPPVGWKGSEFPAGLENNPVTNISYRDAIAYCDWLSRSSGDSYRLPTEEEWEFAARGFDNRIYPWGDYFDERMNSLSSASTNSPLPVSSELLNIDQSPFNAVGMASNVSEWTASLYRPYPGAKDTADKCDNCRVVRGGNFKSNLRGALNTGRRGSSETFTDERIGFRVVKESR